MFVTRHLPLFYLSTGEVGGGGEGLAPEGAPETTANTPGDGTGTVDQQTAQTNWEDRYKEAQAWGTRNAQELAEARQKSQLIDAWNSGDADQQRWAAEQLGIQLEEENDQGLGEAEYAPVDPKILKRLEAFEQAQQQQEQTQAEQQQYTVYRSDVDPQLKQMGVPEALHDAVAEAALNLPGIQTPQGVKPDLQGALAQIEQFVLSASSLPNVQKQVLGEYRKTKQAPHISSSGQAGTQVPPLGTHANRVKRALELQALDDM